MAIRVYWETVKKWARNNKLVTAAGAATIPIIAIFFLYLQFLGVIEITGYSPDYACVGTIEDPCYAYFNISVKNDTFVYPIEYDPYGRNTPFIFNPGVESWKLERSWGSGWREIKLNETCSGTWCGGKANTENKFAYAFREGRDYQLRLTVIKHNKWDKIKWGAWDLDPTFLPIETTIKAKGRSDLSFVMKNQTVMDVKAGQNLFEIKSNSQIKHVRDISDTKEWEYDTPETTELIINEDGLFIHDNKVCSQKYKVTGGFNNGVWTPQAKEYDCIYYPEKLDYTSETDYIVNRNLTLVDDITVRMDVKGYYDPTVVRYINSTACDSPNTCTNVTYYQGNDALLLNNVFNDADSFLYYKCDEIGTGSTYDLGSKGATLTWGGNAAINTTGSRSGAGSCLFPDKADSRMSTSSGVSQMELGNNSCIAVWVYPQALVNDQVFFDINNGNIKIFSAGTGSWRAESAFTTSSAIVGAAPVISDWNHVVYSMNDTGVSLWVNTVKSVESNSFSGTAGTDATTTLGTKRYFADDMMGMIDELIVLNRSCDNADVATLYAGGIHSRGTFVVPYAVSSVDTVNVSYNTREDDAQTSICFTVTGNSSLLCSNTTNILLDSSYDNIDLTFYYSSDNASKTPLLLNFTVSTSGAVADTTNPSVSISYPTNTTYTSNVTNITYTASDEILLDSCWWTQDSGSTNSTVTCNDAIVETFTDGHHSITVYANDSSSNIGSDSVDFTVDTTSEPEPPFNISSYVVSCYGLENNLYDSNGLNNLTAYGNGTYSSANAKIGSYSYYFDGTDDQLETTSFSHDYTTDGNISFFGWYYYMGSAESEIFELSYGQLRLKSTDFSRLDLNTQNLSDNTIVCELALSVNQWQYIGFTHYENSTGYKTVMYINGTPCKTEEGTGTITYMDNPETLNIGEGFYDSYDLNGYLDNLLFTDIALSDSQVLELYNSSAGISCDKLTYQEPLPDTTPPDVSISYPINTSYIVDVLNVTYTASDGYGLNECWWTNDSGVTNNTVTCNDAIIHTYTTGHHSVTVYADDAAGNVGSDTVDFTIGDDTSDPEVTISYPTNTTYASDVTSITYTATDNVGLDTCWWTQDAGDTNSTVVCNDPITVNLSDNHYSITVYANDSENNIGSDSVDFTVDSSYIPPQSDAYVVLNMTFNDESNLSHDSSQYHYEFTTTNTVDYADSSVCKWYGCADFNTDLGYLSTHVDWNLTGGYAESIWVYITEDGDTETQGYTRYGTDTFGQYGVTSNDDNYGFNVFFSGEDDSVNLKTGDGDETPINVWTHYFAQYSADGSLISIYRNGEHFINTSVAGGGALNWTTSQEFFVGRGMYSADMDGYMDELVIYNRGNFTADEIKTIYDSKALGTPPNADLYVDAFKYDIPFDFSATNNTIDYTAGTMDLNITIKNYGSQNTNQSTIRLIMDGTEVCNYPLTLDAWEEDTTTCSYPMVEGFHIGYIYIDGANNTEADTPTNNITVYVPLVERVNFFANMSAVQSNCDNETGYSSTASDNACDWSKSFAAAGTFNPAYDCDSADPYAGNGRTYAIGCFRNDYNEVSTQCVEGLAHLDGWSSTPISSCTSVQAFHQYMHVGIALNTMFPILTEEQVTEYSNSLLQKCMFFTNFNDVQPYFDNKTAIVADNGKGFGAGMAGLCYNLIGLDKDNPSLLLNYTQLYYKPNVVQDWSHREDMLMYGYKNETDALYQEGWAYATYALPHLTENLYFRSRFDIESDVTIPDTAYCSALTDYLYTITDGNYLGDDVIGGDDFYIRAISRGDSESYKQIDDALYPDWAYITMMATMCDDDNVKKSVLWLRNWAYATGDSEAKRPYATTYAYFDLANQVSNDYGNPANYISKGIYDNANDIMLLRSDFSYFDDTIIQIDGGEEIGGGHSTAQGYFISAFGEPFLDYVQVPYEDDVRDERWQNGISLDVTTQGGEGLDGHFEEYCGDYSFNQYYGSKPTENICYYPTVDNFPDERQFPSTYGGDQEDYLFTADVNFGGSYVWRPYYNVLHPVEEYFVKVGDILLKRSRVSGNGEANTQENFISIDELFTTVNDSVNFTMNRNNITGNISMKTNLVYSNTTMTLKGGKTAVSLCFAKTSCEGSNQGNSNYTRRYLESSEPDADFIFYHHWYKDNDNDTILNLTNGINIQNTDEYVYFDTDNDLTINESVINANGWAAYYDADDNKQGGFNTTDFNVGAIKRLDSDIPVQFFIDVNEGVTELTITTTSPTANRGIDEAQDATVIIDLSDMTYNTNFTVNNSDGIVSSGTFGSVVNFVASGENEVYTITGGDYEPPTDTCTYSGSGDHTFTAEDNCVISSEVDMDGNSWYCRGTGTLKGIGNIVNYASGWIFGPCVAEN